jgi:SAM-dependent methyltransferase
MTRNPAREKCPPPPLRPPGASATGKLLFRLRILGDLQSASVLKILAPWLAGRNGRVLEVGCGAQPYRHLLPSECSYIGLDWGRVEEHFGYRVPSTVHYDGRVFPFADGSFDSIFHTEVLEHVYETSQFLGECRRVLKAGGEMFFTVPFQARYHYIPFDFWRYTPAGLKRMMGEAGFAAVEIIPRGNDLTVVAYKNLVLIYRWLRSGLFGKLLGVCAFPCALLCLLAGHLTLRWQVGSTDDCLGYGVRAKVRLESG